MDSLVQFIKVGSLEDVKTVINKGDLIFDSEWVRYKLLKTSLIYEHKEIAQFLIENNFQDVPYLHKEEETPLHIAVKLGWKNIVELLLEKGASVVVKEKLNNATPIQLSFSMEEYELTDVMLPFDKVCQVFPNMNSISHLHIACARNNVDIVKKYLQLGQYINDVIGSTDMKWAGYTPLHFAVKFNSIETVEILLKGGADITSQDRQGNTPLHLALELQSKLLIDLILSEHMYKFKNPKNINRLSHFHIACTRNNSKIVDGFLQCGVDINAKVLNGRWHEFTALHFAVVHQCNDVIKLLLAQKSCSKNYTEAFLSDMYKTSNVEIEKLVLSTNRISLPKVCAEQISPLFKACIRFQTGRINSLIRLGVSVNEHLPLNSNLWPGATPLHIVIENEFRRIEIVELLLKSGADVSAIDAQGRTPIHVAFKKDREMASLLLGFYSKWHINLADKDGLSLFHIACAIDNEYVDKFLSLENNEVDVNVAVSEDSIIYPGFTPLHIAVRHLSFVVVRNLFEHNADLELRNCSGIAPFNLINEDRMMQHNEFRYMIIMMLEKAHEVNCTTFDSWGFNPLHVACINEDETEVRRYIVDQSLINATIERDSPIYRGFTPLHFAALFQNSEIQSILLNHGADCRMRNAVGDTPLHTIIHPVYGTAEFRVWRSTVMMSEFFDDRLFSIDENPFGSITGYSHFHLACFFGKLEIVKSYLLQGVEPNLRMRNNEHLTCVLYNMRCFVDNCETSKVGETGLHVAVRVRQGEVIRLLLDQGADVNALNHDGETPMHLACNLEIAPDLMQAFVDADPDMNMIDGRDRTALQKCEVYDESCKKKVKIVVEHVLRLQEVGCPVSELNLNHLKLEILPQLSFNEELFRESCAAELKRMGRLRQMLRIKSAHELRKYVGSEDFCHLVTHSIEEFPIYGTWLRRQYQRGLRTKQLVENITPAIKELVPENWIPDECAEHILEYLTNVQLQQLKRTLTSCFPSCFQEED